MPHSRHFAAYVKPHRPWRLLTALTLTLLVISLTACNMPTAAQPSLEATIAALDVQSTVQAQQASQNEQATQAAVEATRIAHEVQSTLLIQQATQLAGQATQQAAEQAAQPTAPPPTATQPPPTAAPTQPPPAAPTQPPTETPTQAPTPTPDYAALMKSAKILLFEDMAGTFTTRYIKNALDIMGLPYTDVADASGNFKTQILSGTDWDLIIVGAEARTKIQGEFFVYLNDELNKNTSVIIEIWALDDLAGGKISNILTRCGVKFQKDWIDPEYPSLWYLAPEHPLFHEPNEGMALTRFVNYWFGDVGDLIELTPGSNATLLVGNIATEKSRYGTVATCLDGRLLIQTHSSHNYRQDDMTRLWQNYIYYTLKNHMLATGP